MIRKIAISMFLFFLASHSYGAPLALPAGNYQADCQQCQINENNQLVCQCPMPQDKSTENPDSDDSIQWVPRTVDLDGCEENRVNFINGYLFCDNSSDDDIESVKGTEQNPVLDENGIQVEEPSLDTPPTGVQLDQDMNVVTPEPEQSNPPTEEKPAATPPPVFDYSDAEESNLTPLPPGDYIKYCSSCKVIDGVLNCECYPKTSLFSYTSASISVNSCGKGEPITYRGGALICQKHLWRTLYWTTCWDCEVKDNELTCTCLKTPCQWSEEDLQKGRREYRSTLEDFRYCTKKIINCNGQLRCGGCNFYDYYEEVLRPYEGERVGKYCYHLSPKYRFIEDWLWQ